MKVFRPSDGRAAFEWARLRFAQRVELPVPTPVALDAEGEWFGCPALVMSRLPGRVDLNPTDLDSWLRQIARTLAVVHETSTVGADGPIREPLGVGNWELLELKPSALVERAVAAIRSRRPEPPENLVLMHGDFHPGNILWKHGSLSGLVDWSAARLGSRWFEVAYCRADVTLLFGLQAARRLTEHYVAYVGIDPVDLPVFDLMCGVVAHRFTSRWLGAFQQQGSTATQRQFDARVVPFLRQALAELGA